LERQPQLIQAWSSTPDWALGRLGAAGLWLLSMLIGLAGPTPVRILKPPDS
jgi:hypothetical protein